MPTVTGVVEQTQNVTVKEWIDPVEHWSLILTSRGKWG